tara:strand:+ start:113 stop:1261 length:1149 start_codon:yes stop_codon:yes gene_type:complete
MKKICVVVGSRANYSSIKSVMFAVKKHPKLKLQVVACASAMLERYGSVIDLIQKDFNVDSKFHMLIEGETPLTMAKSTGLGLIEMSTILKKLNPDIVVTVGDRYETMSTAIAAAYMNIPLAHTMGGEVSGNIDESIRHAVTKFAQIHFPACNSAAKRIIKLGEKSNNVYMVGCPRMDLISHSISEKNKIKIDEFLKDGVGEPIDIKSPFLLVSQHPVTTEYGSSEKQIVETLNAIRKINIQAIVLWPNADAGADDLAKGIRRMRENNLLKKMHFFKNFPTDVYITLMSKTLCLIGNSSSGIREGAFMGTPVVNIGTRQRNREQGKNVINVDYKRNNIYKAILKQIKHGKYKSERIYGDGKSGERIAKILSKINVKLQKEITY